MQLLNRSIWSKLRQSEHISYGQFDVGCCTAPTFFREHLSVSFEFGGPKQCCQLVLQRTYQMKSKYLPTIHQNDVCNENERFDAFFQCFCIVSPN